MIDLEVKRKELETAKRIRDNGYTCGSLGSSCRYCPCDPTEKKESGCRLWNQNPEKWDTFISTREAELAALEETPKERHPIEFVAHKVYAPGSIPAGEPSFQFTQSSPTLDDFALALIQGGYFQISLGEDAAISNLVSRSEKIKAALDARRGA